MPEDKLPVPPAPVATPPEPPIPFHIGEEYGTAAKNLPPIKIVLIAVVGVVLIAVIVSVVQRPRASATGSIDDVVSVEVPNQNLLMVAVAVSVHNGGKTPFWIRNIKGDLDTGSGNFDNEAASAVDFERYFQAFPVLKQHALAPLRRETRIEPGGDVRGTVIVSFPVTSEGFAKRKSLQLTIQPYDQPVSLVLSK